MNPKLTGFWIHLKRIGDGFDANASEFHVDSNCG